MKNKIILYYSVPLLLVFLLVLYLFLNRSVSYKGDIIAGVNSEVIITRNDKGIPNILAKNLKDAFFAIGFLHAHDGLPIMEYFRSLALGRMSELIGEKGVLLDKLVISIGFMSKAEEILKNLKSPYKDYLKSYIKGINLSKYKIKDFKGFLNVTYNEWSELDVISILLFLEWSDSYLNNKELFFPLPTSVKKYSIHDIIPPDLLYLYSQESQSNVVILKEIRKILLDYVGTFIEGLAFYICGNNTIDGKSMVGYILDNSMRFYPKWYPLSVEIKDIKVDGVTCMGLPFIFFGNNRKISFIGFYLKIDTQDFNLERTKEISGVIKYYRKGTWKNFNTINKVMNIGKGRKEENQIRIDIRETVNGPIISDIFEGVYNNDVISLRSIFMREDYISSLFEIPFSETPWDAWKRIKNIYSLPKIYFFGNEEKVIKAYSGKLPVRNIRSKIFKRGWDSFSRLVDLSKYVSVSSKENLIIDGRGFENEPKVIRDYIINSNKGRSLRLKDLIRGESSNELKDVKMYLYDKYSGVAKKYLQIFHSILKAIPVTSAKLSRIYFNDWNLIMNSQSVPTTIFNQLLIDMFKQTIGDEFEMGIDDIMGNYSLLLDDFYNMLQSDRSTLFDDVRTVDRVENRDMIFNRAFLNTMRFLNNNLSPKMEDWRWGRVHKGYFHLPLSMKRSFLKQMFTGVEDIGIEGGNSTVSKGSIDAIERLRADIVSCLSCIFYGSSSYISLSYGISLNPSSEYYGNYNHKEYYTRMDESIRDNIMRILPQKID